MFELADRHHSGINACHGQRCGRFHSARYCRLCAKFRQTQGPHRFRRRAYARRSGWFRHAVKNFPQVRCRLPVPPPSPCKPWSLLDDPGDLVCGAGPRLAFSWTARPRCTTPTRKCRGAGSHHDAVAAIERISAPRWHGTLVWRLHAW